MTAEQLKEFAYVWSNIDRDTLENYGIMKKGQVGGNDWGRFNKDPMMFILKCDADKLAKLAEIITTEL